jgi:hypothetical protein
MLAFFPGSIDMSDHCQDHQEHGHAAAGPAPVRKHGIWRFLGWFIGFSGLYSMSAVCPFCGRPGCPTGAASAGLIGLMCASLCQWGRSLQAFLGRLGRHPAP